MGRVETLVAVRIGPAAGPGPPGDREAVDEPTAVKSRSVAGAGGPPLYGWMIGWEDDGKMK